MKLISLMLALSLFCGIAKAETAAHEDQVHLAAHLGVSYAINTLVYGACTKAGGMSRTSGLIFAAMTTLAVGALYKMSESASTNKPMDGAEFRTSMFRNALGVGLSAGTVLMFEF